MGFCGVFWRPHLTARSRETHTNTQGSQKRRVSESRASERIRARKRKRDGESGGKHFLKAPLPCLFWVGQTILGLETLCAEH